jgi:hypothetical protein
VLAGASTDGLGLQVGASMMSCKISSSSSNPAKFKFKFRDFIREIKQRVLKLSSADDDWDVDL